MEQRKQPPSLWEVIKSVLAAACGVQSNEKRERDFTHGKPMQYIVIGLVFTLTLVLAIFVLVKLVLALTGV